MVIFYFFPYLFFIMIYFKAPKLIYGVIIFFVFIHFYLYLHMYTFLDFFSPTCDSFVMAIEVFVLTAFHHSRLKAKSDFLKNFKPFIPVEFNGCL